MSNPNSRNLAMRDPALAAVLGLVGNAGADFGAEFGDDFGTDFGADEAVALAPTPANMQKAWAHYGNAAKRDARTKARERILEPNAGSDVKVERYAFSLNQTLTLGTAVAVSAGGNPDTNIRPQRVSINAPAPGFGTVTEIKVANVSVTVGGIGDMFEYNAMGVGQSLDMPTLSPANRASILGAYNGFVPTGYVGGFSYILCVTFKGPSSIVA